MRVRDVLPPQSPFARLSAREQRADAVHLVPASARPIHYDDLSRLLDELADHGVRSVRTAALTAVEADPFLAVGFRECGRLAMLSCQLDRSKPSLWRRDNRLRRGRSRDHAALLDLDARGFPDPWRFDEGLLNDALAATPTTRFRVATDPELRGYVICGVAGSTSYLQRLAVAVNHYREGIGRALVDDGRRWAGRRGATSMMVNTAVDNLDALAFYAALDFTRRPATLVVLEHELER